MILRNIFGGEALNAVCGGGTAVYKQRHINSILLRITKWIDLDQSPIGLSLNNPTGLPTGKGTNTGALEEATG